ncbi:hypothetical protein [Bacillus sp. FJAT-44742]|uniref:hypothetical protein n=1 Tax=Bacillus sp. FJAT-44742 TaxID=2014005 RepID=UPI0018E27C24|nr:hypothetical protein [Bacillus sp. FJAT-44742]
MEDFTSITVSKGEKMLEIHNPTSFPLIGMGSQGAVFKLSEEKCVKIYEDPVQAEMEGEALKAGQHLPFMPKLYETGQNYIVMEYFNAPNLKEYLKNCMFMPENIARKLLDILDGLKSAGFTMIDAPLRHIFVMENEELKVVDHVNGFKRNHPVPLKLLRDLKIILLKESFLMHVKKLDPVTYTEWDDFFNKNQMDFRDIVVGSKGPDGGVKVDSAISLPLIGKGHQGAVYRIAEDKCVKIYGKLNHAKEEQNVLLSSQNLPFIPKVFETQPNYTVMEYLLGPDLNSFLKKQRFLSIEISKKLLDMLVTMKNNGFKQIDAPLRHIIITKDGFKLIDHVYSFQREQSKPLELFENLSERKFLSDFIDHVKELDPKLYSDWNGPELEFFLAQETEEQPETLKQDQSSILSNKKTAGKASEGASREFIKNKPKGNTMSGEKDNSKKKAKNKTKQSLNKTEGKKKDGVANTTSEPAETDRKNRRRNNVRQLLKAAMVMNDIMNDHNNNNSK